MTCIHRIGSSVVDYVIFGIPLYNKLIDFNIFNDHDPDSYHRPLIITLNLAMHSEAINNNSHEHNHLMFD